MNFKYLIVEHEGMFVPILFSTLLRHDKMKELLGFIVVGAGHVHLWVDGEEPHVELCGRSGTLDIDPKAEDAELILEDYKRLRGSASLFVEPLCHALLR